MQCARNPTARWQDLGARCSWQGRFDIPAMLQNTRLAKSTARVGSTQDVHAVVVTARFTAAPPGMAPGQSITWLFMDPADALGKPDPHWLRQIAGTTPLAQLGWLLRLPYPVGSEDNSTWLRFRSTLQLRSLFQARQALRQVAQKRAGRTLKELEARGDAIYRIERHARHIRLTGLRSRRVG